MKYTPGLLLIPCSTQQTHKLPSVASQFAVLELAHEEGSHRMYALFACPSSREHVRFPFIDFVQERQTITAVQQFLGLEEGLWRETTDIICNARNSTLELLAGENCIDETVLKCLIRAPGLAEKQQLVRLDAEIFTKQ